MVGTINGPQPWDIDEYCRLDQELAPKEKRRKYLRVKIEGSRPELATDPLATAEFEGQQYVLKVGPRCEQTKVTGADAIYRFLGIRKFLAFVERCQLTLKALEEAIPDETARQKFTVTARTGWRSFDVTKKFTEAA